MDVIPPPSRLKIASAVVWPMRIPFRETFRHHLADRASSDSVIVKVVADTGAVGYGEGVPRPYVTGEQVADCVAHVLNTLLPAIAGVAFDTDRPDALFEAIGRLLPVHAGRSGPVVWNAARCAVELAVADCVLRAGAHSLAEVLPPRISSVTYSGVLSPGSLAETARRAKRIRDIGLRHVKIKISRREDAEHIRLVRDILGPGASLRLDANGAFDKDTALHVLEELADVGLESVEQPVPGNDLAGLAAVRAASPIPVMVDESLVTLGDAECLIAAQACDLFNLRLSKCGGISPTLALADRARQAGIGCQLGCQAGESAILSAAGRHVAAHLGDVLFVEGSYGELLLTEDVASESIAFGHGGIAPLLTRPGLGITVCEGVLAGHSAEAKGYPHD